MIYLLSVYSPADTVTAQPGQFEDDHFGELYVDLTEKGSESLAEAFMTGATIEDLDIKDLLDYLALTENEKIIMVLKMLEGSGIISGLLSALTMQGASSNPSHRSATFEEIINTSP